MTEYKGLADGKLTPFLVSSSMLRIDVAFCVNDNPLLLFEVHSNKYDNTLAHCAISLIFQLRYIRLFDQTKDGVSGFVFPNKSKNEKITLITVLWEDFNYKIKLRYLTKEEVFETIENILITQAKPFTVFYKKPWKDYFMGLSGQELDYLRKTITETPQIDTANQLEQIESSFSILVRDEKHFYKICPDNEGRGDLFILHLLHLKLELKSDYDTIPHLVLPTKIIWFKLNMISIFEFDAQPHQPLTQNEVSLCLENFIEQAVKALTELHEIGYAHCDVRLPNFCFSNEYEAMLIDFDRIQNAKHIGGLFGSKESYFDEHPAKERTAKGLDFKQLRLLMYQIIEPEVSKEDILNGNTVETGFFCDRVFLPYRVFLPPFPCMVFF